jgi:hypothetical protein
MRANNGYEAVAYASQLTNGGSHSEIPETTAHETGALSLMTIETPAQPSRPPFSNHLPAQAGPSSSELWNEVLVRLTELQKGVADAADHLGKVVSHAYDEPRTTPSPGTEMGPGPNSPAQRQGWSTRQTRDPRSERQLAQDSSLWLLQARSAGSLVAPGERVVRGTGPRGGHGRSSDSRQADPSSPMAAETDTVLAYAPSGAAAGGAPRQVEDQDVSSRSTSETSWLPEPVANSDLGPPPATPGRTAAAPPSTSEFGRAQAAASNPTGVPAVPETRPETTVAAPAAPAPAAPAPAAPAPAAPAPAAPAPAAPAPAAVTQPATVPANIDSAGVQSRNPYVGDRRPAVRVLSYETSPRAIDGLLAVEFGDAATRFLEPSQLTVDKLLGDEFSRRHHPPAGRPPLISEAPPASAPGTSPALPQQVAHPVPPSTPALAPQPFQTLPPGSGGQMGPAAQPGMRTPPQAGPQGQVSPPPASYETPPPLPSQAVPPPAAPPPQGSGQSWNPWPEPVVPGAAPVTQAQAASPPPAMSGYPQPGAATSGPGLAPQGPPPTNPQGSVPESAQDTGAKKRGRHVRRN